MRLFTYLSIGTLAMLIPIIIQGSWYQVKLSKRILIAVLLTCAGTLGTFLLYFVENGHFGGTSFFGAVFFVPVLFIPVAKLVKMRLSELLDLCAPAECAMLVIMKVRCYLTGCCGGWPLKLCGYEFTFPSQLAELVNALIICLVLLNMCRKEKNKGKLYPLYMVIYGVSRFVLNIFRKDAIVEALHMPFGNFWALVAVALAIVWLIISKCKGERQNA